MRHGICSIAVIGLLGLSSAIADGPADRDQYRARMDVARSLQQEIGGYLEMNQPAKAGEAAMRMTNILQREEEYWMQAGEHDVLQLAAEGVMNSVQLTKAAQERNIGQAMKAYNKLQDTCNACHDLHPERRAPRITN